MQDVLYQYELNPTTWVYFSSLLTLAIFFKFNRLWSIRNLDLLGLIALSPGLLLVSLGQSAAQNGSIQGSVTASSTPAVAEIATSTAVSDGVSALESMGYFWLFLVGLFFLIRLLADPLMARRPLLEPNLSAGGLAFLGLCLFVFLMANVVTAQLPEAPASQSTAKDAVNTASRPLIVADDSEVAPAEDPRLIAAASVGEETSPGDAMLSPDSAADPDKAVPLTTADVSAAVPGFTVLDLFPRFPSKAFGSNPLLDRNLYQGKAVYLVTGRVLTILCHFMIVAGLIYLGARYFNNYWTGIGMAALYLMLPYTAYLAGDLRHAAPGALLVWMMAAYRRPLIVGSLLAIAIGAVYYPMFLIPLFIGFYWQRGVLRFSLGLIGTFAGLLLLVALLAPPGFGSILQHFPQMFSLSTENLQGFWATHSPYLRIPLVALFLALCFGMAIWPAQKNLGTLMSCSAAVMLGTQFWYPQGGLLFMNWYLPLLLLTVFRPNLENRMAVAAFGERWARGRRIPPQAA